MLRLPVVPTPGGFLHVTNHVADGERPFLEPDEVESFVERIPAARQRDRFTVFAWCLMSNHYHLVLRTREVPFACFRQLVEGGPTGSLWMPRHGARPLGHQSAIDRGVALPGFDTDLDREPRPEGAAPDIGAYESRGQRTTPGGASRPERR